MSGLRLIDHQGLGAPPNDQVDIDALLADEARAGLPPALTTSNSSSVTNFDHAALACAWVRALASAPFASDSRSHLHTRTSSTRFSPAIFSTHTATKEHIRSSLRGAARLPRFARVHFETFRESHPLSEVTELFNTPGSPTSLLSANGQPHSLTQILSSFLHQSRLFSAHTAIGKTVGSSFIDISNGMTNPESATVLATRARGGAIMVADSRLILGSVLSASLHDAARSIQSIASRSNWPSPATQVLLETALGPALALLSSSPDPRASRLPILSPLIALLILSGMSTTAPTRLTSPSADSVIRSSFRCLLLPHLIPAIADTSFFRHLMIPTLLIHEKLLASPADKLRLWLRCGPPLHPRVADIITELHRHITLTSGQIFRPAWRTHSNFTALVVGLHNAGTNAIAQAFSLMPLRLPDNCPDDSFLPATVLPFPPEGKFQIHAHSAWKHGPAPPPAALALLPPGLTIIMIRHPLAYLEALAISPYELSPPWFPDHILSTSFQWATSREEHGHAPSLISHPLENRK